MITRATGRKLITVSGFLAILLNIAIIVVMIWNRRWAILFFSIARIILHVMLFVIGYCSRQLSEFKFKTFVTVGLIGCACSGWLFISDLSQLLIFHDLWSFLYLLALPVCILFSMGTVFYERGEKSDYD